ncbi:MAG: DUF4129 domain-containing transglutaminase family protein [Candidatus Xenobia bacterium]
MTYKEQVPLAVMTTTCIVGYIMNGFVGDNAEATLNLMVGIPAGLALLLAPWIPWRYHLSKRMSEWLYVLLAIPFVIIYMAWNPEGQSSPSTNPITELSTVFLICLAVQEQYRSISRPIVIHFSLLGVLFHAGMSYDLKWFPALVAIYAAAASVWLTHPNRRSAPLPLVKRAAPLLGAFLAVCIVVGGGGGLFLYLRRAERQVMLQFARLMYGSVGNLMAPLKDSELGSLARLRGSSTVVARWWGPTPDYLKARVFNQYTHNKWDVENDKRIDLQDRPDLVGAMDADGGPVIGLPGVHPDGGAQVGRLLCDAQGTILAPQNTFALQGRIFRLRADPLGILHFIGPAAIDCGLMWEPGPHEDLSGKPADDPIYLSVPPELQARIEPLARQIAGNQPDVRGKAAAIAAWLQQTCTYRLDPPAGPPGEDRLITFLFRNHQGYCEYFASGMGLMLRTLGVRCRYVIGYLVEERNTLGGYYMIRNRDAHAWLEVYVPGRGWTLYDPTPPAENAATYHDKASWMDQVLDQYGVWFTRFWASVRSDNWKLLLKHMLDAIRAALLAPVVLQVAVVGLLGIALAWIVRGHRSGKPKSVKAARPADPQLLALQKLLKGAESRLARNGLIRRQSETLLEFRDSVPDPDVRRLLEIYCEYYYGARQPPAEALAELRKRLR